MIKTSLYLSINEPKWEKALTDNILEIAEETVNLAVNFIQQKEPLKFISETKELCFNLCLSNDKEIHALNKEFRGIDKPTNVLSFANIDDLDFEKQAKKQKLLEMGDMIIALETMQQEAKIKNISLHDHFCHLLTHSVLHLLGYDHLTDTEAEHMENFEIQILQLLNINNPYEE